MNPYEVGGTWYDSLHAALHEERKVTPRRPVTLNEIAQAILSTGHPITERDASLKALELLNRSFSMAA